jgi:predicted RNA-binding Zn-ribbon protein involved in translation (DUF1610 family)
MAAAEKKAYRCEACSWKFRRSFLPKLCPNCGKESIGEDASTGAADDILREIEDMEKQFG